MKLPKRIQDILNRKQEFIDSQRDLFENSVVKQQVELFSQLVSDVIPELDVKDGLIQDTAKNYRLLSALDKTYNDFRVLSSQVFLDEIVFATAKVAKFSGDYFKIMLGEELPARFDKIVESTTKLMNLRLGLDGGKLVRGGFLQSFFDLNTVGTELKQMTSKAITSNMDMKDYVQMLKDKITGTKEYTGGLERQFQRYAYDIFQQYDRAYNTSLGKEFGFNYFIYQGGLVKDSREFCVLHNNKVYSIDEAQDWCSWVSPTTGLSPTYMCYDGYDPMIDFGGYNCRHSAGFIPDAIAKGLRPGLE